MPKIIYKTDDVRGYSLLVFGDEHEQVVDVAEHEAPQPKAQDAELAVDEIAEIAEMVPATYRKETDHEMIKRLLDKPWLYQPDPLPERFSVDWTKDPPALKELPPLVIEISSADVNREILEMLKQVWGGDSQNDVALKHQNAVGILGRLVNKELTTGAAPTSEELALKEGINDQLELHENILKEGKRIKALTPVPENYKELLQAVL